jgi:hypothetical protein
LILEDKPRLLSRQGIPKIPKPRTQFLPRHLDSFYRAANNVSDSNEVPSMLRRPRQSEQPQLGDGLPAPAAHALPVIFGQGFT